MSFSTEIKEELSKMTNLANKELIKYELIGYLISSNTKVLKNNKMKFSTESEYNINRFAKLLKNLNIQDYDISLSGKAYVIIIKTKYLLEFVQIDNDINIIFNEQIKDLEQIKTLIRGIFLGAGYINQPENKYHLELNLSNETNGNIVTQVLLENDIKGKTIKKKNEFSIYLKDGEEISKFFAFIGSNKGVIKFEEVRVQRQMNNKINRLVNCEAANLNKTINASIEQIEAIKKLQDENKFDQLDDNLKELAMLRLENPNASLIELGEMLSKPVGKSGVNYRLKKIIEIAK